MHATIQICWHHLDSFILITNFNNCHRQSPYQMYSQNNGRIFSKHFDLFFKLWLVANVYVCVCVCLWACVIFLVLRILLIDFHDGFAQSNPHWWRRIHQLLLCIFFFRMKNWTWFGYACVKRCAWATSAWFSIHDLFWNGPNISNAVDEAEFIDMLFDREKEKKKKKFEGKCKQWIACSICFDGGLFHCICCSCDRLHCTLFPLCFFSAGWCMCLKSVIECLCRFKCAHTTSQTRAHHCYVIHAGIHIGYEFSVNDFDIILWRIEAFNIEYLILVNRSPARLYIPMP